jgi:hypothetical protein
MNDPTAWAPPEHFGIKQSKDEAGVARWTINIVLDASDPRPRSAYLDEDSKLWILKSQSEDETDDSTSPSLQPLRLDPTFGPNEATWLDALAPSAHTDIFRNLDWSATPLGPCAAWPPALRLYTQMLFSDSRAAAIYWGPERIAIYNASAAPLLGDLHPRLMGTAFRESMPGLWSFYGPLFNALENGQPGFSRNELEIPFQRDGYLEETWWDGGLISLKDDESKHGGVYFSWIEVTRIVLQNRRTALAKDLGLSPSATVEATWQHIHDVLAKYPRDVPMAIMYGTDENDPRNGQLRLRHTIGIPPGYDAAPLNLNVRCTVAFLVRLIRNTVNPYFDLGLFAR